MIRYAGNLEFQEQPGATGPSQAESGLDTLSRTFKGKTIDKYTLFSVTLGSPDRQFPQLFATNVEPVDLEGGLTEFRVTYKGMLSGQPRPPLVSDSIVIKNGTINGEYLYELLLPNNLIASAKNKYFPIFNISQYDFPETPNTFALRWQKRSVDIQVSTTYYAQATTYQYVSRTRPIGPKFESSGVNGFDRPIEFINTVPSGEVQITKPNILVGDADFALRAEVQAYANTPPRFLGINISQSQKKIMCTNFTAEQQGVWWVCSETWEVEVFPNEPEAQFEYVIV